jgi:hypothetical protein
MRSEIILGVSKNPLGRNYYENGNKNKNGV